MGAGEGNSSEERSSAGTVKEKKSDVVAWLGFVVALASLAFTLYQSNLTMQHDRVSVRPVLDWRVDTDNHGQVAVSLINVGLGSAIVRNVELYHHGENIGQAGRATCSKLNQRLGRNELDWTGSCFSMGARSDDVAFLRANDDVVLFASCRRSSNGECDATYVAPELDADEFR